MSSPRGRLVAAVLALLALPTASQAAEAQPAPDPDATPEPALDATAPAPAPRPPGPAVGGPILSIGGGGSPTVNLADLSLAVLTVGGASTATDPQIVNLEGGEHDPKRRGFTLQQVELALVGEVDPYFDATARIAFHDGSVELEEAFGKTERLPCALQLKAGKYLTEFGLANPQHAHEWHWVDQPVVGTRLFGPEGLRGIGARLSWAMPVPWHCDLIVGMQNADDEAMVSFLGGEIDPAAPTTIAGRPAVMPATTRSLADFLYSARWINGWELPERTMLQIGLSSAFGPNNTGPRGRTAIVGADLVVSWHERESGHPELVWQTEVIERRYEADAAVDPLSLAPVAAATLRDWGLVSQALVGFSPCWSAGLRADYDTGDGDSYVLGVGPIDRQTDPLRDDRWAISPLIVFSPTEYSKIRLQYDYDHAEHLPGGRAQSVWLGLELVIGAHPEHHH